MAVLGNPDAYHLPSTPGAGWFKVDATVYERFEAALVGAPHRTAPAPSARRAVLPFRPLAPVEGPLAGQGGHAVPAGRRTGAGGGPAGQRPRLGGPEGPRPGAGPAPEARPRTDVEVVVAALAREARRTGGASHQVWLPPLAPAVTLGAVLRLAHPGGARPAPDQPEPFGGVRCGSGAGWLR